jgi:effector-binding domain-containing protein
LGDSIEKNIVDYDFSDSENEYVSEIQIPIRKLFGC